MPGSFSLDESDASDEHHQTDTIASSDESLASEDELDSNEQYIPITGFAVSSRKRNADFHELFPSVPEDDYLIEDYGCALQRDILIQGRIYISEHHICFHANIFGWITNLPIPLYEITAVEKKRTSFINAIRITTPQANYTFSSFLSRNTTYDVIATVWRFARPDHSLEVGTEDSQDSSSHNVISTNGSSVPITKEEAPSVASEMINKVTHCACSKSGDHFKEIVLETVFPGTPDKIYNLMSAGGFIESFMRIDQKFTDVQISDWSPITEGSKLLTRNVSYIKPLNNSAGLKQTKCEIHDENVFCDFDDHVVVLTTMRTPDVPSGDIFVVKTRTCLMWASMITTRMIVTTQVDWTGRKFIKGPIERSTIESQKMYHSDLAKAMRLYIQERLSEFIPEKVCDMKIYQVRNRSVACASNRDLIPLVSRSVYFLASRGLC
ncbi:GRAM-domain-containing protein [Leucogyrophana mollusca]|uniref:GRAM-domain-containing protein n=1 Tax=Leucogyrophana mollusca TaxID=85980 RepID=A0ACB8BAH9_9AGAM|nr:GRAM-domain-containing protein [Leucogyrophana mollusca]